MNHEKQDRILECGDVGGNRKSDNTLYRRNALGQPNSGHQILSTEHHNDRPAHSGDPSAFDIDRLFASHQILSAQHYNDRSSAPPDPVRSGDLLAFDEDGRLSAGWRSLNPNPNTKDKQLVQFPVLLYAMLERIERDGRGDVVSWQPHGRCFLVRKPESLSELMPVYFSGMAKYSSFQRQVC
jgi:HSF-type DNA-binding